MSILEDRPEPPFQVELRNATKLYGAFAAIRDVSIGVAKGEFFSILGPSGGGKTTVLRAIAGLLDLTSGELMLAGAPVRNVPVYKRGIGIVFQNYALFPHMNVFDNIAFGLRMRRLGRTEVERRVGEAMERVHLTGLAERRPSELSGGQQQRVALARAIVVNPSVILLDEPLGALDRNLRIAMQAELKTLQRDLAISTICVTHDQEEALSLSDRIAILNHGEIQQIGTPVEIYERPDSRFVAEFVGGTNLIEGTVETPGALRLADGTRIPVLGTDGSTPLPAAGAQAAVSLRHESLTLLPEGTPPSDRPGPTPEGTTLEGTVVAAAYAGAGSLFHVRISDGLTLIVSASGPPAHTAGDRVRVHWPAGAARLLAR